MIKKLAPGLIAILALAVAPHQIDSKAAADPKVYSPAIKLYLKGDLAAAIDNLENIASGNASPDDRMGARLFLAQMCAEIEDLSCLDKNNTAMLDLQKAWGDEKKASESWVQIAPSITRELTWLSKSADQEVTSTFDTMDHVRAGEMQSDKYLMLQSSEVSYFIRRLEFDKARNAISRMAARAVVLPINDYMLPNYLVEIISDLYAVGDGARAFLLVKQLDNVIRLSLPPNNPTHIRYLEVSAALEASFGDQTAIADGLARLDQAQEQARHLRVSQQWSDNTLARQALLKAELLFWKGDAVGAQAALLDSPLAKRRGQIESSGHFSTYNELTFAVVDLFLSRYSGRPIDPKWKPLLAEHPAWESGDKADQYLDVPRKFGLALAASTDIDGEMLEQAAFDSVKMFETSLFSWTRAFPIPEFTSRIIIGTELVHLSKKPILTPLDKDFVVRAIDILQRSIIHTRGDALYLLSKFGTERDRRQVHTWLLLADRRSALELQGLVTNAQAGWAQRGGSVGAAVLPKAELESTLNATRSALVDIGGQLNHLRAENAEKKEADGASQSLELPGSATIEKLLGNNEAFVSEAPFAGSAFKVCVGPSGRFAFSAETIKPNLPLDLKLLRASLTASYAPSEALDRQYPADAALRVRNFVFGGLDSCYADVKRVFYNPIVDLADIPLPALLETTPPRVGDGFDLTRAAWLANRYEFSYVSSAEEFVAARRLAQRSRGEYSFLGIGDPELSNPLPDGRTGGQMLASRGAPTVNGSLTSLPELPETGDELRQIAGIIPGSTLLLRHDATVPSLFRQPIGHFNTIEFATHGLITGDLRGISEPGLVLTPVPESPTNASDDGFLSSTKLSTLNLRASLVVLSACNTANFEVDSFVGSIRGLTSALAEAGVPTVVASLWPVETNASKTIMSGLYAHLRAGANTTVATAFAGALKDYLHGVKSPALLHPRFWSAFVVYGDGGETVNTVSSAPPDRLLSFDANSGPGEVLNLLQDDKTSSTYDSGFADWTGRRLSSVVQKRSLTGKLSWEVRDTNIGAGPLALGGSQIYSAGYESAANGTQSTPLLRAFDTNGHLRWKRRIEEGASQSFATDIAVSQSGTIWVLVQSQKNSSSDAFESHLRIVSFDTNGTIKGSWFLETTHEPFAVLPPKLALGDHGVYLFEPTTGQPGFWKTDDFGATWNCVASDATEVFEVLPSKADVRRIGRLSGVVVMRAKRLAGKVFVSGSRNDRCEGDGEPYFGEFHYQDGKDPANRPSKPWASDIYAEEGMIGGQFGEFILRKGEFILTGHLTRRIQEFQPIDPAKITPGEQAGVQYQRTDSFLIDIPASQKEQRNAIHFIDAGADTFIDGIVSNDNAILLAGSVGGHSLWARYRL